MEIMCPKNIARKASAAGLATAIQGIPTASSAKLIDIVIKTGRG